MPCEQFDPRRLWRLTAFFIACTGFLAGSNSYAQGLQDVSRNRIQCEQSGRTKEKAPMDEQQSLEAGDELISTAVSSRWQLIWHDEFDGPPGSKPDERKWTPEVGGGGWGNQELEYYTDHNAYEDGKGHLVIEARLEYPANSSCWYGPCRYTSARLISKGKFALTYGRVEARMQIPSGQGIWPALWMLGQDIDVVGWPGCGEIDIMENIGREPATIHGTIHGPNYAGGGGISWSYSLKKGRFGDRFHRFAMEWDRHQIAFFVDGTVYFTVTRAAVEQRGKWVFDHPFYLLLNVAVGGSFPGDPDSSSTYPQSLLVDYVRVYQRR
jgi:beta-glucanase (GH16 family)